MFKPKIKNITCVDKKMFLIQKKNFQARCSNKIYLFFKEKEECNISISSHSRSDRLVVNMTLCKLV